MVDKGQGQATNSLHSWGFWTYKVPDLWDNGGKSDSFVFYDGRAVFVEVKNAPSAFSFKKWRGNQRHWAKEMCRVYNMDYWLWLELGKATRTAKEKPKRAWLLPFEVFEWVESLIQPYQDSIPLEATKKAMKALHLDALHLLNPFNLPWGRGSYTLPLDHPFYLAYRPPMIDLRDKWIRYVEPESEKTPKPKTRSQKPFYRRSRRSSKSSLKQNAQLSLW